MFEREARAEWKRQQQLAREDEANVEALRQRLAEHEKTAATMTKGKGQTITLEFDVESLEALKKALAMYQRHLEQKAWGRR